ncbi:MAG: DMT family transporter [Candidatus Daviesbacteria bacterium]|nr:DMT family transporter [Candidatus Daviesbacteria bacterium]
MVWQLLVAISVVTYSISIILQRLLLKDDKSDPIAYSVVFQLLTGLIIGVYALIRGFSVPDLVPLIPNLVLMILLYGAGNIFIFKALKLGEASDFTILFASRTLWIIIAAVLFLKESFTLNQTLGTFLIIASVAIVTGKTKILHPQKSHIFALLGAAVFGLAFANDAFILRNFDVPSYLFIAFVAPALTVWALNPKSTQKMKPLLQGKSLQRLGILGVIYAVSAITIFLAYQIGRNAAQIAPLNQTSTMVTVILGILLLKERDNLPKKLLGAVISFVGVLLLL